MPDCRSELRVAKSCSSADSALFVLEDDEAAVVEEEAEVEDVANGEFSASCERVTKSCCAAERLPLCKSVPSCWKSVLNCSALCMKASSCEKLLEIP